MKHSPEFSQQHIRIAPGIYPLQRNSKTIQLGLNPQTAVQLPNVFRGVLDSCDGSHTVAQLAELALEFDLDKTSTLNVIELLIKNGLLISSTPQLRSLSSNQASHLLDAQRATHSNPTSIANRTAARITIVGAGRNGSTLALLLGNSGFANIRIIDSTRISNSDLTPWGFSRLDVGARRDYVVQTLLERVHREQLQTMRLKETRSKSSLIVFAPDPIADIPYLEPHLVDLAVSSDTPYLVLASSDRSALVTAINIPGVTGCVRCFHLHQQDQDSDWPKLISQLVGRSTPDITPTDLVLRAALFSYQQIANWIDFNSTDLNHWWYLSGSTETVETQNYPHVSCGCFWLPAVSA